MNSIKQKAIAILEKTVLKAGTVLDVRFWEPATFVEIDVHLPETDMRQWNASVQHMKCKVAPATYRDYTPACWDAGTHTCTLFINTSHQGAGSKWAGSLQKGDTIEYLGISGTSHKPLPENQWVFIGDNSSIGHFLALQQLATPGIEISGAIALPPQHHRQFAEYLSLPVTIVNASEKGGSTTLTHWLQQQRYSNAAIYIAGHIPTSVTLRSQAKQNRNIEGRVKVQGFWD
ncbi:Siderophore-interacting FAD-binding domain-containing protein [Filimonas lacunae]|uniref:Siderophore-interacting FAD-binding domain-containing protein n=1 Tax=Filimonas lacunae TaxID=477680 RepID=A0A173MNH9_9BACT|nr:siderophore-interacting protein [Filimonas lacunae]BAV09192.1 hypothetical protein FLA_5240 [Filimonas lacunae]SIS68725.1 Siderophore-interacting FAD-binding domain-containing protein [Filimonas lacunae]